MILSLLIVISIVTGIQTRPEPENAQPFRQPLSWEPQSPPLKREEELRLRFDPYDVTWNKFKSTYARQYADVAEEQYRRSVFMENIKMIEAHNWDYFNQKSMFYMGINQFADMTKDEFLAYNRLMSSSIFTQYGEIKCSLFLSPLNAETLDDVDWRSQGYVTPVKNQGHCGSCWAFSATGSLEGQYKRLKGQLLSLSEQQLVDCSSAFGNKGCSGGHVLRAFMYINSTGGSELESDYPYTAQDGSCKFSPSQAKVMVTDCRDIQSGSESELQRAVSTQGPASVSIDVTPSFHHYKGGIFSDTTCKNITTNHAVLVVGYGGTNGSEYWIVKNSWAQTWGEQGYIRMSRNYGNMCGIASRARFPVVS